MCTCVCASVKESICMYVCVRERECMCVCGGGEEG